MITPLLVCVQAHARANAMLNMREGPGLLFAVVGQWQLNEQLDIYCSDVYNGEWYLCQDRMTHQKIAWSHKDYLIIEQELWNTTQATLS